MRINLWSTLAGAVALTLVAVTSDIGRAADVPPRRSNGHALRPRPRSLTRSRR